MDRGLRHCTEDRDQDHPYGKEMQKSKMAVWGGLIARRDKKAFFSDQCKEIEENNRRGRLEISSRKQFSLLYGFYLLIGPALL